MNLPNKLTTFRVILIPFFVFFLLAPYFEGYGNYIALVIFIVASLTDFLDGKIARKYNLVTNLGKLIDPLADKLLVISALVVLTKYGQISLWIVLLIIFRELLITSLRAIVAAEGKVIAAETLGKWKTASQMILLSVIILFPLSYKMNNILLLIPLILTLVSGFEYVMKSKNVLMK